MIPLAFAEMGNNYVIQKIGGTAEVRKHLENLGFITGDVVSVISSIEGNIIVQVKESRVAINKDMAMKIMV
ncbi:FeoA family protein [Microaceticoccus formicicus]|uniref:FeoA family protein n=1 Tax=Microaceticoccus formicicus TaxID=3118105 RepID=UPI003CD016DF|nr:FeoA family protein [Peptoniphilaceae bacterium AMB_02]